MGACNAKVENIERAAKAEGVSGVGTGPAPAGCGKHTPLGFPGRFGAGTLGAGTPGAGTLGSPRSRCP